VPKKKRTKTSRAVAAPRATAPRTPTVLTGQAEDYLKAIYELEQKGTPAGTNDIAGATRDRGGRA
jgi:hypothetical protein